MQSITVGLDELNEETLVALMCDESLSEHYDEVRKEIQTRLNRYERLLDEFAEHTLDD
jgi:hypothetical protein